jgi:hypothetical protein
MTAKVRHIVDFDDGTSRWAHDLPPGSDVRHLNAVAGWAGRVVGPTHDPYWLGLDGKKSRKGPDGPKET